MSIDIPLQGMESEVVSLKTDELPTNVGDIIDVLSNLARKESVLSKWIEVSIAYYSQKLYEQYEKLLEAITNADESEYVSEDRNKAHYLKLLTSFAGYYLTKALRESKEDRKSELLEAADGLLTKSKGLQPLYFENFIGDGMLALATGNFDSAGSAFTTALAKKATHFCGLLGMACVTFHQRKYKVSLEYFQKCLRQQPNFVEVRRGMGLCFYYLQQYDKSEMAYERVLQLDPNNVNGLIEYAFLQLVLKKSKESTKKAFEHITRAIRLRGTNPPPVGLYLISHHYFIKGDFVEARKFFSNCFHLSEIKELKAECLFYLGQILHQQGEYEKAYNFYQKSEKFDPDFILNLFRFAQLLIFKSNIPEAIERLEKIKDIFIRYGPGSASSESLGSTSSRGGPMRGGLNNRLKIGERHRRRKKKKDGDDDTGRDFVSKSSSRSKKGLSNCNVNLVARVPKIEKEVLKLLTHLYFQTDQLYLAFESAKVYYQKYLSRSSHFLDIEEEDDEDTIDVIDYYLYFVLGVLFGSNSEDVGGAGPSHLGMFMGGQGGAMSTPSGSSMKIQGRSPKITLTTIATTCFLKAKELLLFHNRIRQYFRYRKREKVKMLYHLNNNLAVLFYKQGDVLKSRKFFNVAYYYLLAGLKLNEKASRGRFGLEDDLDDANVDDSDDVDDDGELLAGSYGELNFDELDVLDGRAPHKREEERDEDEDDDEDELDPGLPTGMDKRLRGRYVENEKIQVDPMFLLAIQERQHAASSSVDVVPFLFNYGLYLELSGEGDDAKVIYLELIKRYPRYKLFYVKLILYHLTRKEFTSALKWSKVLLHVFSSTNSNVEDQKLGYLMLGYVHLAKHEWNFAQKRFEYVLKNLNESDEFSLLCLGNIFLSQPASASQQQGRASSGSGQGGKVKEDKFLVYAAKCFEKVLLINEYNVFAALSLSISLAERGYLMDSKHILNRLKDLSSGMTSSTTSSGSSLSFRGSSSLSAMINRKSSLLGDKSTSDSTSTLPSLHGKVIPKVNFSSAMGSMIEEEVYINLGHIAFCEKHLGVASKYYEICLKRMLKKFHTSYYHYLNSTSATPSLASPSSIRRRKKLDKMKDEDEEMDGENGEEDEMNNPSLPPPVYFEKMEKIIILYEYLSKSLFCNHQYPAAIIELEKALKLVQKGLEQLEPYRIKFLEPQKLKKKKKSETETSEDHDDEEDNVVMEPKYISEIMSSYRAIFHSLRYLKNEIRYNLGVTEHESGSKILIEQKNIPVFAEKAVEHIRRCSSYFTLISDEITKLTSPPISMILSKSDPLTILKRKAENYRRFVEKDTAKKAKRNLDKAIAKQKEKEEERKRKLAKLRERMTMGVNTKMEKIGMPSTPISPISMIGGFESPPKSTKKTKRRKDDMDEDEDEDEELDDIDKMERRRSERKGEKKDEEEIYVVPPPPLPSKPSKPITQKQQEEDEKKKMKTVPTRKFQILEEMEQRAIEQNQIDGERNLRRKKRLQREQDKRRRTRGQHEQEKKSDDDDEEEDDDGLDVDELRKGLSMSTKPKKKKRKLLKKVKKPSKPQKKKGKGLSSSSEEEEEEIGGGLSSSSEEEEDEIVEEDDDDDGEEEDEKKKTPKKKKLDSSENVGSPLSPQFGFGGARLTRRQIEMKERGDDDENGKQEKSKEDGKEDQEDENITGKKRKVADLDEEDEDKDGKPSGMVVDDEEDEVNFDEEEEEEVVDEKKKDEDDSEKKDEDEKETLETGEPPKKKRKLE